MLFIMQLEIVACCYVIFWFISLIMAAGGRKV